MEKYALVFWPEEQKTSVISTSTFQARHKIDALVLLPSGNKNYPGKVVEYSG